MTFADAPCMGGDDDVNVSGIARSVLLGWAAWEKDSEDDLQQLTWLPNRPQGLRGCIPIRLYLDLLSGCPVWRSLSGGLGRNQPGDPDMKVLVGSPRESFRPVRESFHHRL